MAIFCEAGRGAKKGLFKIPKKKTVSYHKGKAFPKWNAPRRAFKPLLSPEREKADTCSDNEFRLKRGLK